MEIIGGGRQSGKTYKCIQWLLEEPDKRIMVVPDSQQKEFVIDTIRRMWVVPEHGKFNREYWLTRVLTSSRAQELPMLGKSIRIDNLDMILYRMFFGNDIDAITWSVPN